MAAGRITLTVADVDRWSAAAVREVFHAAIARSEATLEVARQLDSLSVFDSWQGSTALARRHATAAIRLDLDAHGNESLAVARAAAKAADGIAHVQSALSTLRRDAAALQMVVDGATNTVAARTDFDGPPVAALIAEMQLQRQLDAIMAEADSTDCELAAAIDMADGDLSIPPGPHDNRPQIQVALSKPLPDDPKEFTTLWNQLCAEEKDWLYDRDHNVGNHSGMPWDPPDNLGKDHYNRMHLAELQATGSGRCRPRHPGKLPQVTKWGSRVDDGAVYALLSQLSAANDRLAGYAAMSSTLVVQQPAQSATWDYWTNSVAAQYRSAIRTPGAAMRFSCRAPARAWPRLPFSDEKALAMYTCDPGPPIPACGPKTESR